MACEGECAFVEEQEPGGRLILGPCLGCGTTAMDALGELKRRAPDDLSLVPTEDLIGALFARCDAGIIALYADRSATAVTETVFTHGNYRIGQGLACAVIEKINGRLREESRPGD